MRRDLSNSGVVENYRLCTNYEINLLLPTPILQ